MSKKILVKHPDRRKKGVRAAAAVEPRPEADRVVTSAASAQESGFPIVAIGASAGGLEAMSELLGALPRATGLAFVFIQHSAPSRASLLPEILERAATMPIVPIASGMRLEADHGYVVPPGTQMDVVEGALSVEPLQGRERESSIDHAFAQLAAAFGSRVVGVVLSGTLSDGAQGLKAIKAAGGVTIAQDEESAKYSGMPHAAADLVDLILPPAEIARRLPQMARHAFLADPRAEDAEKAGDHAKMLATIRASTGVNFSLYRQSTIRRRILRRMALHRIDDLTEYTELVRSRPEEQAALFEDLLITVTSFFRDPAFFDALRDRIFPLVLSERREGPVRMWVPGCSSGEEAYSLAITLLEAAEGKGTNPPTQIFGTDVSERAIAKARAGLYSETAMAGVSEERRRRFFRKTPAGWQVISLVRDCCVFARQNLASDPPFSNLDVVSCRNLLIYLDPSLQARILRVLHYALRSGGYLLLGGSESVGTAGAGLFVPFDRQQRIYSRSAAAPRPAPETNIEARRAPETPAPPRVVPPQTPLPLPPELQRRVDRIVLGSYAPPGVLVDDSFDVVQFRGKTGPFLEPAPGTATLNVLKMAREGLLVDLQAALLKARRKRERIRIDGIRVRQDDGRTLATSLEIVPLAGEDGGSFLLVLFEPVEKPAKGGARAGRKAPGEDQRHRIQGLEQELEATKEYLQSVIEEQQAGNEELKSANEEILSSNEELQSTNEELETTKEELQATNEELSVLNEELSHRAEEKARAFDDVANLLDIANLVAGLDLAVVMLDPEGRIRRTTPEADRLFELSREDVGKPVWENATLSSIADLRALVTRTAEAGQDAEREVQADGRWFLLRIRPYRTAERKVDGLVLGFFDIDPLKRSFVEARRAREYAESLIETVPGGLVVLDEALRIRSANRGFLAMFGAALRDVQGTSLFDLPAWRAPASELKRRLLRMPIDSGTVGDVPLELEVGGAPRKFAARASRLSYRGEEAPLTLVALEDVTEKARLEGELREAQKLESIGTLAGGVAHDFNNILGIVVAHAALAERRQDDLEKQKECFRAIDGAVRRGGGVVRQLLTFARRSDLAMKAVKVNDLVAEVASMVAETFPKSIEIEVRLDPRVTTIAADANQIHQALLNLCVNARDAMPEGGRLVVKTALIPGSELIQRHPFAVADKYVAVVVSDTGVGMDDDTRKRAFEPFFTTKASGMGTGLGLAVVYGVVNTHHGVIEMETAPGRGTTFSLYLPISSAGEDLSEPPSVAPARSALGGSETILVVEDEEALRDGVKALLEDEGYEVLTATDGIEAAEAFEARAADIDVVVLDLGLPRLDGPATFERIMRKNPNVRCIAVSGNMDRQQRIELHASGVMASLRKPYTLLELLRLVRLVVDGPPAPPPA